jgi:hypothetical protein
LFQGHSGYWGFYLKLCQLNPKKPIVQIAQLIQGQGYFKVKSYLGTA